MTRKRAVWITALLLVAASFGGWAYIKVVPAHPAWLDTAFLILGGLGALIAVIAAIFQAMQKTPGQMWEEAGPHPGAPCQAPRPLANFVGRQTESGRLVKALQPGGKAAITGIVGMGGIGKTELAKVVAHQVVRRFHDGVLWAACGQEDLGSIADRWATFYGVPKLPGDDFLAKAAAWRGLISQKEALLIFDDVRPGQAVDELFPPHGRSAVLLTSRQSDHPALQGIEPLQLDQFKPDEAMALAEKVLGQAVARRQQVEATHLFELLGYLPLAVSIALSTAQRNGWRLAVLNQRLEEAGAFKALDEPGLRKGLAATFQTAWVTLPADQQRAFATLAVFNQGPSFDTAAFAAVLETDAYGRGDLAPTASALLHRLAAASLLTQVGEGLGERSPTRLCSDYPGACTYCLDLRLAPRKKIPWLETAVEAARRLEDKAAEGRHVGNLGLAYARLGEVRRAIGYYEQALAIDRESGDRRGEGSILGNLGLAYKNLGEVRQAIGYYEQALAIAREIGDRRGEGADLGNLGLAYAALGEVRRAIGCYEQQLVITREIGDRRGEGNALNNLGIAYKNLGEVRQAIEYYEQALAIAREIGDRRGEGNALANLGLAREKLGNLTEARRLWQEALAIFQAIEAPEAKKVQGWLAACAEEQRG